MTFKQNRGNPLIRIGHNKLVDYWDKKLKEVWGEEWDPVSIKIELYSLGIHAGMHQEKEDISIPFDILEEISNKFNVKTEELLKAYTKGVVEGRKEKKNEEV